MVCFDGSELDCQPPRSHQIEQRDPIHRDCGVDPPWLHARKFTGTSRPFSMPPTVPTLASPLPSTTGSSFPQPHMVLELIISILEKAFSKQPTKHFHQATHFCTTYRFVPGDLLEDDLIWCRLTGRHLICPWQLLPPWDVRQVLGLGTGKTILNIK